MKCEWYGLSEACERVMQMREEGERCEWREWCEEKLVAALHEDEVRVVRVERSLRESDADERGGREV
jgi:hypothetical protein